MYVHHLFLEVKKPQLAAGVSWGAICLLKWSVLGSHETCSRHAVSLSL